MITGTHDWNADLNRQRVSVVKPTAETEQQAVEIGSRLKARREELGLSAREVARQMDTDDVRIHSVEKGRTLPTRQFMRRLTQALRMDGDQKRELMGYAVPDRMRNAAIAQRPKSSTASAQVHDTPKVTIGPEFPAELSDIMARTKIKDAKALSDITGVAELTIRRILSGRLVPGDDLVREIGNSMGLGARRVEELIESAHHDNDMRSLRRPGSL